ncbi:MAG: WD40 repeat domain-containing protein, partial [Anaerolineae bacterium]
MVWDLAAGSRLSRRLGGHQAEASAMAFDPGGQILASGGDDGTIRFWDVATGQPGGRPLTGLAGVNGLAWIPEEQVVHLALVGGSQDLPI